MKYIFLFLLIMYVSHIRQDKEPDMAESMNEDNAEPPREAKLVTAIVIGAGNRGQTYSGYALEFPDKLKVR